MLLDAFGKQQMLHAGSDDKLCVGSERKDVGGCCACYADKLELGKSSHQILLLLLRRVRGRPQLLVAYVTELLGLLSLLLGSGCSLLLGNHSMLSESMRLLLCSCICICFCLWADFCASWHMQLQGLSPLQVAAAQSGLN